jgi:hypothetical protein
MEREKHLMDLPRNWWDALAAMRLPDRLRRNRLLPGSGRRASSRTPRAGAGAVV